MRLLLVLVCFAGCVRAELIECGDLLCTPSQICVSQRCIDPSLVCTEQGAECDSAGAPGRCTNGVCEPAGCGNGYLDTALREDCDDTVPDVHCVDVGFDLGRPGCTACQTDLRIGCISFGWRLAVNSQAERLWTDGETFAYWRFEPSSLEVHGPGVDLSVPSLSIYDIRGGNGRIVVSKAEGKFDIVGGQIAPLVPPSGIAVYAIDAFDVTPDGTLHVVVDCAMYSHALGGTWVDGPKVPTVGCIQLEVGSGHTFVATTGDEVWMQKGNAFVRRFAANANINDMAYGTTVEGDALWLATSAGLSRISDDDSVPKSVYSDSSVTTVALASGLAYGALDDTTLVRWDGRSIGRLQTPSNNAITSDGEHIFAYRGPVYEFSGIDFSRRSALPNIAQQDEPVGVIQLEDAKSVTVVTSYGLYTPDPKGLGWVTQDSVLMQPLSVRAAAGVMNFSVYSAYLSPPEDNRRQALGIQIGGESVQYYPEVPDAPFIHGLWVAPDHTIYAAGDDEAGRGFLGIRTPADVWTTFSPTGNCAVRGMHAIDTSNVIAVGGCDGAAVVWRHDGSAWSELARLPGMTAPLSAVRVFPADILVAVGTGGVARLDGATWTIDATVTGNTLSGTPDDLWVSGSFTNVQHYDGTNWSQMTTRSLRPIQVIAHGRRILLPGAAPGFGELLR